MKETKVKDLIRILQSRGVKVRYRIRSDGGVLITSIGKQKFKGAKGNIRAREIVGAELSAGRKEQLALATRHRKSGISTAAYDPDKMIAKLQRRINRKRRKYNIEGGGIVTKSKVRYWESKYGKEMTIEMLTQQERYAEGLAYDKNIAHLIQRFEDLFNQTGEAVYQECADLIKTKAANFKEEWIQPIYYDVLDQIDKGTINSNEALSRLKQIMII